MPKFEDASANPQVSFDEPEDQGLDLGSMPGWVFHGVTAYFDNNTSFSNGEVTNDSIGDLDVTLAKYTLRYAGGQVSDDLSDSGITHVIVGSDLSRLPELREALSRRRRLPRIVTMEWIQMSWKERTRLDEERFAPTRRGSWAS